MVITLRWGRTMSRIKKLRSSRRSRGNNPARRNDDLPVPEGPNTTNMLASPDLRIPRKPSKPPRIWASRPKNTAASGSSSGSHPRYGARSGSLGGGHTNDSAPIPAPTSPSRSRTRAPERDQPVGVDRVRGAAVADIDLGGGAVAE